MANSLGDIVARVGADISGFTAAMETVSESIARVGRDADRMFSGFDKIGANLSSLGTQLSVAITAPLVGLGGAAIKVASDMQTASVGFTTLLGSAEAAGSFLDQLKSFAASTPFQFPELVDTSKHMLALGFAAKDIVPDLRIIGDQVSALGGGADKLNSVVLALGQMGAKGKVSAQEMNQLADVGVKAWDFLATAIGKTVPEAMKLAENGAISASVAIPAILEGMRSKTEGLMAKMSETIKGQWSNIGDQITFALADVGTQLVPFANDVMDEVRKMLDVVKTLTTEFGKLPEPVRESAIAMAGLAAAMGPIIFVSGQLINSVGSIGSAVVGVSGAVAKLTGAYLDNKAAAELAGAEGPMISRAMAAAPIFESLATKVGLAAVAFAAFKEAEDIFANFKGLMGDLKVDIWDSLKKAVEDAAISIRNLAIQVMPSLDAAFKAVSSAIDSLKHDFSQEFKLTWLDAITGPMGMLNNSIKEAREGLSQWSGKSTDMDAAAKTMAAGLQEVTNKSMGFTQAQLEAMKAVKDHAAIIPTLADQLKSVKKEIGDLEEAERLGFEVSNKLTDAHKREMDIIRAMHPDLKSIFDEITNLDLGSADLAAANLKLGQTFLDLHGNVIDNRSDFEKLGISFDDLKMKAGLYTVDMEALVRESDTLPLVLDKQTLSAQKLGEELNKGILKALPNALAAVQALNKEYRDAGIPNTDEMSAAIERQQKAFEDLNSKGLLSVYQQMEGNATKLREQIDLGTQLGQNTDDLQLKLGHLTDALKTQADGFTSTTKSIHDTLDTGFQGAFDDLITNIGAVGDDFKKLGENVVDTFVNRIIKDAMTPLLNSLDDIINKALKAAESVLGIPTPGTTGGVKAPTGSLPTGSIPTGSIPTGGGGLPIDPVTGETPSGFPTSGGAAPTGGSGSSGGGLGGITGIVGAISGVATAISSIVGNFQMSHMETTLKDIESHTKVISIGVLGISDVSEKNQQGNETMFWFMKRTADASDILVNGALAQHPDAVLIQNAVGALYGLEHDWIYPRLADIEANTAPVTPSAATWSGGTQNLTVKVQLGDRDFIGQVVSMIEASAPVS